MYGTGLWHATWNKVIGSIHVADPVILCKWLENAVIRSLGNGAHGVFLHQQKSCSLFRVVQPWKYGGKKNFVASGLNFMVEKN